MLRELYCPLCPSPNTSENYDALLIHWFQTVISNKPSQTSMVKLSVADKREESSCLVTTLLSLLHRAELQTIKPFSVRFQLESAGNIRQESPRKNKHSFNRARRFLNLLFVSLLPF